MNIKLKYSFVIILFGLFVCVNLACNPSAEVKDEVEVLETASEQSIKEELREEPQKPMLISEEQFTQLVADFLSSEKKYKGEKPCVIDFYADWCRPCKILAPTFEIMAEKYGDKVNFYKINTDDCPNISIAYNITGIPTLFFYDKNGTLNRMMGIPSEEELENAINLIMQ